MPIAVFALLLFGTSAQPAPILWSFSGQVQDNTAGLDGLGVAGETLPIDLTFDATQVR